MGYGILCCLIAKSCPTFETPWIVALILLPVYFDVQIVLSLIHGSPFKMVSVTSVAYNSKNVYLKFICSSIMQEH